MIENSPQTDVRPVSGPQRVGGFELIAELGRGGTGIVYRGFDLTLSRTVALKRPHAALLEQPGFSARFLREARSASRLLHPNITMVFSTFEDDGVPWIAMELVEGVSLRARLAGNRPLAIPEILAHAEGLADALRLPTSSVFSTSTSAPTTS